MTKPSPKKGFNNAFYLDGVQPEEAECPRCNRKASIETTRKGEGVLIICTWCGFEATVDEE